MSIYTQNSEYSILLIQLILLRSVFSITCMGIFLLEGFSSYQTLSVPIINTGQQI